MGLFKQIKPLSIFLLTILTVVACSSNQGSKVQVIDKTRTYNGKVQTNTIPYSGKVVQVANYPKGAQSSQSQGKHIVQKGETLYSLAFSAGRDWRDLANDNNIVSPYIIYPGQAIYLSGKIVSTTTAQTHSSGSVKVTTTKDTTKPTTQPPATNTPRPTTAVVGGWTWPTLGTVIGTYSPSSALNKGIDIAASEGTPVMAASAGTVVYAGNNLHGYGNLLIIKHNESYVSAYGHNRVLLVKEGQKVKAGQKIAEMGSTGADRVKLHFEIRQNGKPVDPLKYLPKK